MNSDGNSLLFGSFAVKRQGMEETSQQPQCMIKYFHNHVYMFTSYTVFRNFFSDFILSGKLPALIALLEGLKLLSPLQ